MMDIEKFIASGLLEEFVLGVISDENKKIVNDLAKQYPQVKEEILAIEESFEIYSTQYEMTPPPNLKAKIMDKINEEERLKLPPLLTSTSPISDYDYWLGKVKEPEQYESMHMEIIGEYESAKMVIAWIKEGEPDHSHDQYSEIFLIVEGSCTATIGDQTADYEVGDYVCFPIHVNHSYHVTSKMPMKVVACLDLKAS